MTVRLKILLGSILSCIMLASHTEIFAQDTPATRQAAVDRYMKAVPMGKMLDDMFTEISKQIPVAQRAEFLADMRKVVRVDFLEKISRDSMVKTFTVEELTALAEFYESKHGSSAMQKFGGYMADVMPLIQAEVLRSVQELQKQKQTRPPA
jgi:hypothetical protein